MTTGRDELPADYLGYELPDSLKMLRQLSRDFNQNEIIPLERDLDYDAYHVPEEVGRDLQRKAKEAGLGNMSVPKEWGGEGMDIFTTTVVDEERVKHRNGLYGAGYGAYGGGPPAIFYRHATQDQVERFVLPSLAGERQGFFAITEPGGGSDPARAIATHATRDGDDWVINGSKMFISGSLEADYGLVFCRTDTEAGRGGISCMIVEQGMPGYTVEPIAVIRPDYPGMLSFQDVRVPGRNVVGEIGHAWDMLANQLLATSRIPYSAANLGVAVAAHEMAVAYSKQRVTFGEPLSNRQAIQWMLVDSEIEIRSARWLVWDAAWKVNRGESFRTESSMAKLVSSEVLGRVVDRSIQIHGGIGLTRDLPLERWYREARIRRIGEGPSEIQRILIARNIINPTYS